VPFQSRAARVRDGSAVPYVEQGDPTGTPVLLVHAYADSWRSFEPVLPQLPKSLHVFALTQRGHGDAERPSTGYALAELAAELASFLDAVGVLSAVIVGASSGGYVAQRFALDWPERTLGLVLVGAPRSLTDPPAVVAAIAALEDPVDPAFVREFVLATSSERVPADFLETMISESSKLPAHVWRAALAGLVAAAPPTDTGTIAASTLILWGEADALLPRADQEQLAAAIPDSRLVVLPGVGHAAHWEAPERVAVELSAFIAGLSR
jgi:rifampin ADP-ribosylating transferase